MSRNLAAEEYKLYLSWEYDDEGNLEPDPKRDTYEWLQALTPVASVTAGCYSWATFHALWNPQEGVYVWAHASGCSCTSFAQEVPWCTDWRVGSRAELLASVRDFAHTELEAIGARVFDLQAAIYNFKETRA